MSRRIQSTHYHCSAHFVTESKLTAVNTTFSSLEPAAPSYAVYEWSLEKRSAPMLLSKGTLDLDTETKDENLIAELAKSENPKVISFSPDLSCIRVGPRVFVKEKTGNYVNLDNLKLVTEESSPCFEHVVLQKSDLVLASRTKLSAIIPPCDRKQKPVASKKNEKPDVDVASKEETKNNSSDDSKERVSSDTPSPSKDLKNAPSDEEADDESVKSSSKADSSAWNSAEESWSEASTEADEEIDAAIANLESSEDESSEANESDTDSDNGSKSSDKDNASDAPVATQGGLLADSDYDSGEQNLDWLDNVDSYDETSESELDARFASDSDNNSVASGNQALIRAYGRSRAKRYRYKGQQGLLMVYDFNQGHPAQLFKFSHLLTTVLEDSPPAIHPTKPLVVWPLSGGDILFADYRANSYFIRKFKPSTRKGMYHHLSGKFKVCLTYSKASHEFVQCRFSPCGRYLRIASLESQVEPVTKKELKKGTSPSTLLSAFISTHRLSKRKTTRSPPSLIHRVKISLGKHSSTKMPIQITWSAEHAFISSSSPSNNLSLFRVELFAPPKGEKKDLVCVPREPILLPKSARSAVVQYFPPRLHDSRAMIAIGSSTNDKDEEAKSDKKPGKDEKIVDDEKSRGEKVDDNTLNDNKPKTDPANNVERKDVTPQEDKPKNNEPKDDTSKDTAKNKLELTKTFSPPTIFYLNIDTELGGWILSDAIEEIKSGTAKGSLEQKMDKFIEDDCCG